MATGGILAEGQLIKSLWDISTGRPKSNNKGRLFEKEFNEYRQAIEDMKDDDGVKVNY